MHGYPSNFMDSNFLNMKRRRNCSLPEYKLQEVDNRPVIGEVDSVNKWLLAIPSVGTAAYYLMYLLFRGEKRRSNKLKSRVGPGVIIYSLISTGALALYVFNVLVTLDGKLLDVYIPITGAAMLVVIYYAAVYTWIYLLDPDSFKVDTKDDVVSEIITFLYFSATTFVTAGGDIVPVTNTARILVALHVLYFEFALTMGLVFFIT